MDNNCENCQDNMIDANVARVNAGFVFLLSILFIFSSWKFALVILVFDFFVKVFAHPQYAPTSYFSRFILDYFRVKPKYIFAPPKLFAAKIGLAFALMTFTLYLLDFELASFIICGVLAIFSVLELVWEFCMGCWVYSYLAKWTNAGKDLTQDKD